jgi:TolA-binding protein
MKRLFLTAILLLTVLTSPVVVSTSAQSDAGNTTANNTTVQDLQETLQERNQRIDELETTVVEKNAEIQKLESRLNTLEEEQQQTQGREWIILKTQDQSSDNVSEAYGLFQYCPQKEAGYDFDNDGVKHYCQIPIEQQGNSVFSEYKVQFKYMMDGENQTYIVSPSNAESRLRQIAERANRNDPAMQRAYEEWMASSWQSAETGNFWSSVLSHGAILGLGVFLAVIESKKHILFNRRKEKERQEQQSFFHGEEQQTESLGDKIRFWR